MALWQYDLRLIPKACNPENFDKTEFLRFPAKSLKNAIIQFLEFQFGQPRSWMKGHRMWGLEDGDRIDLVENDFGGAIKVRIDLRAADDSFLTVILDLAHQLDAVFLSEGRKIIAVDHDAILAELRQSEAARFVKDPRGYLRTLK